MYILSWNFFLGVPRDISEFSEDEVYGTVHMTHVCIINSELATCINKVVRLCSCLYITLPVLTTLYLSLSPHEIHVTVANMEW